MTAREEALLRPFIFAGIMMLLKEGIEFAQSIIEGLFQKKSWEMKKLLGND